MKDSITEAYNQIVTQDLEEGKIANAIGSLAVAGALVAGIHSTITSPGPDATKQVQGKVSNYNLSKDHLLSTIKTKFKHVDDEKASHIVDMAMKYSHPVFPKAHDILAISGIESSFNEKAKSKLKRDPAVGLMQVRPAVWGIDRKEFSTIEGQIKHGAHILRHYYEKTGSRESAIKAYNVGLTNFNKGKQQDAASRYLDKFKSEVSRYSVD